MKGRVKLTREAEGAATVGVKRAFILEVAAVAAAAAVVAAAREDPGGGN